MALSSKDSEDEVRSKTDGDRLRSSNLGVLRANPDHQQTITVLFKYLVEHLDTSVLWDELITHKIISIWQCNSILESEQTNDGKARRLLLHLARRNRSDFEGFLQCLRNQNQGHIADEIQAYERARSGDNVEPVQLREESFFEGVPSMCGHRGVAAPPATREGHTAVSVEQELQLTVRTSLLRLCGKVEAWTWARDKTTISIDQIFTDLVWVRQGDHIMTERETLGNYTDMLQRRDDLPVKYVFLEGLAGTGKSTLVKMLAMKWCRLVGRNILGKTAELSDKETKLFSTFEYLVVILLRYIRTGQTLEESIQNQYCVEKRKASKLYREIVNCQEKVLFVFDGYDEYTESDSEEITAIVHRQAFPESTLIVTSRHPPSFHFDYGGVSIYKPDNHVMLRGFSRDGVKEYIRKFFHNNPTNGNNLSARISQSEDLKHLSHFPAVLLLMCTLWKHDGSLSKTTTGFYRKIVEYLCGLYELKYVRASKRAKAREILNKYHDQLMKIGEVSVCGIKQEGLMLSFPYHEVKEVIDDVGWKLGILRTETDRDGEEFVVFHHKSIQEFFVSFFIVHSPKAKQRELLVYFCTSIKAVKQSDMIQTFISGLGGDELHSEVESLITSSEEDRAQIVPRLQLSYMAENQTAQLSLPQQVLLTFTEKYTESIYRMYLSQDVSAVTRLTIEGVGHQDGIANAILPAFSSMHSMTELKLDIHTLSVNGLDLLCHQIRKGSFSLTKLDLEAAVGPEEHGADWPTLIDSLPVTIEYLNVSLNNITDQTVRRLSRRLVSLKRLQILAMFCCRLKNANIMLELFEKLDQCPCITEIHLAGNKLDDQMKQITKLGQCMTSLRRVDLEDNILSDHVKDHIRQQLCIHVPKLELWL